MQELPVLADFSKESKKGEVGVIALIVNKSAEGEAAVRDRLGNKMKDLTVIYPDKELKDKIVDQVTGVPFAFYVDSEGKMIGSPMMGAAETTEDFENMAKDAIKDSGKDCDVTLGD